MKYERLSNSTFKVCDMFSALNVEFEVTEAARVLPTTERIWVL
jgi:hypothetical protein